jgi:ribosomal protein S12 methylthiotransferase
LTPHKIGIVSLGCAKNLVDTEILMKQLDANHFQLILDPTENDRIDSAIINTCGFILDAKNESVDTILRFVGERQKGRIKNLYVMGCLSERYKDKMKLEIPEVDAFFGVNELKNIIERIGGKFRKNLVGERIITTPSHYSYLKISEGCDRKCSFCSIPFIRGKHISRPMEEIVREAKRLANKGIREINVISQDTTYYGLDLYKKRKLPELLDALAAIKGLEWIRLHYTYPDGFPVEILDVIRDHDNICKYIDIPLQHINTRILKSMRRGIDRDGTLRLINRIRDKVPGLAIRTSIIVGYPGEKISEFKELKEFVRESKFDRLGVFTYSDEEDTAAFRLKNGVSQMIREKRAAEIMDLQQEISLDLNREKIGQCMKVIIDRVEGEYFIGRSEYDSPEIDNEVLVPVAGNPLIAGNFYNIRITASDSFDLYGELSAD